MADQMKYLLATVALCLLAGCGKPEANNPAADKPESEKTTYEKLVSSISEGSDKSHFKKVIFSLS